MISKPTNAGESAEAALVDAAVANPKTTKPDAKTRSTPIKAAARFLGRAATGRCRFRSAVMDVPYLPSALLLGTLVIDDLAIVGNAFRCNNGDLAAEFGDIA
jgi:hypothetical protein